MTTDFHKEETFPNSSRNSIMETTSPQTINGTTDTWKTTPNESSETLFFSSSTEKSTEFYPKPDEFHTGKCFSILIKPISHWQLISSKLMVAYLRTLNSVTMTFEKLNCSEKKNVSIFSCIFSESTDKAEKALSNRHALFRSCRRAHSDRLHLIYKAKPKLWDAKLFSPTNKTKFILSNTCKFNWRLCMYYKIESKISDEFVIGHWFTTTKYIQGV